MSSEIKRQRQLQEQQQAAAAGGAAAAGTAAGSGSRRHREPVAELQAMLRGVYREENGLGAGRDGSAAAELPAAGYKPGGSSSRRRDPMVQLQAKLRSTYQQEQFSPGKQALGGSSGAAPLVSRRLYSAPLPKQPINVQVVAGPAAPALLSGGGEEAAAEQVRAPLGVNNA